MIRCEYENLGNVNNPTFKCVLSVNKYSKVRLNAPSLGIIKTVRWMTL